MHRKRALARDEKAAAITALASTIRVRKSLRRRAALPAFITFARRCIYNGSCEIFAGA
jgi:hypothetical protein